MTHHTEQTRTDPSVSNFDTALRGGIDADNWLRLAEVWRNSLSKKQRAAIAYASISRLDTDDAAAVFATAHPHAGYPLPTLISAMGDARWWAGLASNSELKAYAVAVYEALPPKDKATFLSWASSVERSAA